MSAGGGRVEYSIALTPLMVPWRTRASASSAPCTTAAAGCGVSPKGSRSFSTRGRGCPVHTLGGGPPYCGWRGGNRECIGCQRCSLPTTAGAPGLGPRPRRLARTGRPRPTPRAPAGTRAPPPGPPPHQSGPPTGPKRPTPPSPSTITAACAPNAVTAPGHPDLARCPSLLRSGRGTFHGQRRRSGTFAVAQAKNIWGRSPATSGSSSLLRSGGEPGRRGWLPGTLSVGATRAT